MPLMTMTVAGFITFGDAFRKVFDQAEIWSTAIPLVVLAFRRKQPAYLRPVIIYLWFALFLYSFGNYIADYKDYLPCWLWSNVVLYNIHSIIRFTCFICFFEALRQPYYKPVRRALPVVSVIFFIVNFVLLRDDFFSDKLINPRLLTVEAYLLLIGCMLYYLSNLKEDVEDFWKRKDFWVTTGLSFYVVINFYVFLFYDDLGGDLQDRIWDVHNIAQIIFCLFIAKAFYVTTNNRRLQ